MSESNQPTESPIGEAVTVWPRCPGPGLQVSFGLPFLLLFLQIMVAFVFRVNSGNNSSDALLFAIITTFTTMFSLLVLFLFYRKNARYHLALRLPEAKSIILIFLITPPILILVGELAVSTLDFLKWLQAPAWMSEITDSDELGDLLQINRVLMFLGILIFGGLFPAISEEVLFRGIIGRGLVARLGVIPGVILTSLLFSLAFVIPIQVVISFFLGIILHTFHLCTRSLIAPMIFRAILNTIAIHLQLLSSEEAGHLRGVDHVPPVIVLSSAGLFIWLVILLYHKRVRWVLPGGEIWSPGFPTAEQPQPCVQATPGQSQLPWITPYLLLFVYGAWLVLTIQLLR